MSSASKTVLYFNRGTSCYVRLLVSIFSLRKYWSGTVTLLQEGPLDSAIAEMLRRLDVQVQSIPSSEDKVLIRRASIWKELEHDYALSLDADTIVCGPVDQFFTWIQSSGFVATWFSGWSTTVPPVQTRIEEWARVAPELVSPALAYGKAINGGVQGWSKVAAILPEYEALTRRGDSAGCNGLVVDEIALQLLLPHYQHYLAHHTWNTSGIFGEIAGARIVHFHGKKHCQPNNPRCELWVSHYFELRNCFPELSLAIERPWGDERLHSFLHPLQIQ